MNLRAELRFILTILALYLLVGSALLLGAWLLWSALP